VDGGKRSDSLRCPSVYLVPRSAALKPAYFQASQSHA